MSPEVKWSEVAQSCPTLCDPMGCSLTGSSVHGIFQARILEWVAISFSNVTWGWPQRPLQPVLESPDTSPDDLKAPSERRTTTSLSSALFSTLKGLDFFLIFCPIFHLKRIRLLPASQEGGQSLESISWLWHSLSSVQSLSPVWLFVTPWTAWRQASLPFTKSQNLLKLMSTEPTISSYVVPFSSHLQCFPASGSFPMNQLFTSGGQSIGVSASSAVLPMNTQDWSPLGWTGWISLQSKGLSGVFSNTSVQKHQFFVVASLLWNTGSRACKLQ